MASSGSQFQCATFERYAVTEGKLRFFNVGWKFDWVGSGARGDVVTRASSD